ncbi:MAG: 4Fe-4S dicluster domain-containing protein [Anaerolineales bacterium]
MTLKMLPKEAVSDWIEHLLSDYRLIAPQTVQDQYTFREIDSANQVELDYGTTFLPPKKVLLPTHEDLIHFNIAENMVEPVLEDFPTVILGVHTCDMHAIRMLDAVFDQNLVDQHYLSRRRNTTLVSIECLNPCSEHSFCKDMGTLSVPEEFDLHLTDLGSTYAVYIGSEKGKNLLDGFNYMLEPTSEDYSLINHVMSKKWSSFPYRLDADVTELPSLMTLGFRSSLWDELGERCLGCGSCTIVCPTCYCFDVRDEVEFSLTAGERTRVWDSCQLNQFASVAGGHDFRPKQSNRQRHRFLRKYKYQSIAPGLVGCVGCGRCAESCLVDITPVGVLNKLFRRHSAARKIRQEVLIQ